MERLSYKKFAHMVFLTAQDLNQNMDETVTDFKEVLRTWQADNETYANNRRYTKVFSQVKITIWMAQKNIIHFSVSPFYLHDAFYLVPQSNSSTFWQEFDDALTTVAQSFKEKCDEITLLNEGSYETDDEDIKYLKFIYFKYKQLIIGFQHAYKRHIDVPFLEGFIAIHLSPQEIPFDIFDS